MANEEQYYNPIIQAMVASAQNQRAQEKLKQDQDLAKQHIASQKIADTHKERQLDIEEKRMGHEHDYQNEMLNIHHELQKGQLKHMQIEDLLHKRTASVGGVDVGAALGQSEAAGIPNSQDALANEVAQFKAHAQGGAEGKLPSELLLLGAHGEQAKSLQQSQQDFQERQTEKTLTSHEKIANLSNETHKYISDATNKTHLQASGLDPDFKPSKDIINSMVIRGLTGQAKLSEANPLERLALTAISEQGGRPVDPKEAQSLKEGQALVPLFDKLRDLVKQLPESRPGAFVSGRKLAVQNAIGYPSEIQNKINAINSQALVIGRAVEGLTGGRVLSKQMELDLNSLASGGIPQVDANRLIDNLQNLYTTKQEGIIMGGMPDAQRELIYKTYGIKPAYLIGVPDKNKAGHKLDVQESIKNKQPVYTE